MTGSARFPGTPRPAAVMAIPASRPATVRSVVPPGDARRRAPGLPVTRFAAQWLYLCSLPAVSPDIVFSDFSEIPAAIRHGCQ